MSSLKIIVQDGDEHLMINVPWKNPIPLFLPVDRNWCNPDSHRILPDFLGMIGVH